MPGLNAKNEAAVTRLHPVERHFLDESVLEIAWHPDEDMAAIITADGGLHVIRADAPKKPLTVMAHAQGALCLAWSADGELLATGGQDGRICLWETNRLNQVHVYDLGGRWIDQIAWGSSGTLAATMGKQIFIIDVLETAPRVIGGFAYSITGIAWRSPAQLVVTTYGRALLIDVSRTKEDVVGRFEYPEAMLKLALSPSGKLAAIGCQDSAARVWAVDHDNDALSMTGYQEKVQVLAWEHSERYLALSGGNSISVWDFHGAGPRENPPLKLGHADVVNLVKFTPRGSGLVAADRSGFICFWDARRETAAPLAAALNKSLVHALAWNATAQWLLSGDQDGSIALWRPGRVY